jgi:hypothetical protein
MDGAKISVLYLASRSPYPTVGGREKLVAQSIEFLARDFDLHLVVFCKYGESLDVTPYANIRCKSVTVFYLPKLLSIVWNIMTRGGYSLQENLFYSRESDFGLRAIANRRIDVVIADMLRTGQFCEDLKIPKVIDLDDLLSERYRKSLAGKKRHAIFGTFSEKIPAILSLVEPYLRVILLKKEAKNMGRREQEATVRFDAALLTSEWEAAKLRACSGKTEIFANPQATTIPAVCWRGTQPNAGEMNCFFIGNLKTAQNLAAVEYIVDEIFPLLRAKGNTPILHAVGTFDDRVEQIVALGNSVNLHGFVSDYIEIANSCQFAMMPMTGGTGVKTKILDIMALGMPIVTNSNGVEGLSVSNKNEIMIGDTPGELADYAQMLVNDKAITESLAKNARNYVAKFHEPGRLMDQYCDLIRGLADSRRGYVDDFA